MHRRLALLALAVLTTLCLPASHLSAQPQSAENFAESEARGVTTTRVLMVGDSWAEFMWVNRSLRDVFAANGRADLVEEGAVTAISGSTAAEWVTPERLQLITDELAAHPTVDVVQLTMGGNDFLDGQAAGGWYVGISPEDFEALTQRILNDLITVIDHVLSVAPDMNILISLYDYTNFEDATLIGCSGRWDDLGQPTPRQINDANHALQDAAEAFAATRPEVSLVDHLGLMQFSFGFPADGIDPGDLIPPGDLNRPSPVESMFSVLTFPDCIHLSSDGYFAVGQNLWNQFYDGFFNGTLFRDGFESGDLTAWTAGP